MASIRFVLALGPSARILELNVACATVIQAWYISQPSLDYLTYNSSAGIARMLSYAVSKDGVVWERPNLGLIKWEGQDTNLLLRLSGNASAQYACVFVDPHIANVSRRYEMLALLSASPPGFPPVHDRVVYQFYSKDGIHWNPEQALSKGPCAGETWCSDSLYINRMGSNGSYTYTAILKHGLISPPGGLVPYDIAAGGERCMFVSSSTDAVHWTAAQVSLTPDWRDAQGTQWISAISTIAYEGRGSGARRDAQVGSTRGGAPLTVGWLPVFHSLAQRIDMQLCATRDGITWWRPERVNAVPLQPLGEYGSGMLWPYRLFVPDRDDPTQLHAYFSGCQGLHGDIHSTLAAERFEAMKSKWVSNGVWGYKGLKIGMESYNAVRSNIWFRGALMRATWRTDRLWALIPASGGDVAGTATTTTQEDVAGLALHVNCRVTDQTHTRANGTLRAELIGSNGDPLPGFSLADSNPFSSDSGNHIMAWKGGAKVPATSKDVTVRFELLRAHLYSFWWE